MKESGAAAMDSGDKHADGGDESCERSNSSSESDGGCEGSNSSAAPMASERMEEKSDGGEQMKERSGGGERMDVNRWKPSRGPSALAGRQHTANMGILDLCYSMSTAQGSRAPTPSSGGGAASRAPTLSSGGGAASRDPTPSSGGGAASRDPTPSDAATGEPTQETQGTDVVEVDSGDDDHVIVGRKKM
nr:unnamed protein product [Digitaria exilis]